MCQTLRIWWWGTSDRLTPRHWKGFYLFIFITFSEFSGKLIQMMVPYHSLVTQRTAREISLLLGWGTQLTRSHPVHLSLESPRMLWGPPRQSGPHKEQWQRRGGKKAEGPGSLRGPGTGSTVDRTSGTWTVAPLLLQGKHRESGRSHISAPGPTISIPSMVRSRNNVSSRWTWDSQQHFSQLRGANRVFYVLPKKAPMEHTK